MFLPEQKAIAGVADHAGYLILRLRYFPAWHVEVNGSPVIAVAERERGLSWLCRCSRDRCASRCAGRPPPM